MLRTVVVYAATIITLLCQERAYGTLPDLGVSNYSCPLAQMVPSKVTPKSVHSLRPADIKVVAALGDSLTAANGARSEEPLTLLLQYRGAAFQIGGDDSLETHVTIPNILKKFNPNIFGASRGIGGVNTWQVAFLNAAVPGAVAADLPGQARDLVEKMKSHSEVNVEEDWKLLNIFIGGNDMCHFCKEPEAESAERFAADIQEAVQIIYDNIPRVLVSLTGMFHLEMLRTVDNGQMFCQGLHLFECSCESSANFTNEIMATQTRAYQAAQKKIQESGIFDQRDDFTFIMQPFLQDVRTPPMKDGEVDLSFFSTDCFHFSQYGHALVATWLWKNLMEPVERKTVQANLSQPALPLSCPDVRCPFIRTTKNSENCAIYLTEGAEEPLV